MNRVFCVALLVALAVPMGSVFGQSLPSTQVKFFETKIRPALVKYCYECHSVDAGDSRGGLLLDTRQGWIEGGDSGEAIVPGKPEESVFWEAINWDGFEMPPSKKMPDPVIADFKKWIEMGAPDPRERKLVNFNTKITSEQIDQVRKEHWAFQKPETASDTSIDRLVMERLQKAGMEPSPMSDPFTLLRRLNFDLIGLPPTPGEITEFVAAWKKNSEQAVSKKIAELLSRPQYGEKWGRHWLDVARYAESSGSRNVSYPHAWRYRDYVIDSFNNDTPYDRFVAEQIAGDLLPVKSDEEWQKNLIATGFLAIGMKHHDQKNPRKFMADMVDEQIDTTTQAVMGLTVACARCHDHKYDPIPTDDYYALAGVFYSTRTLYGTNRIAQNHRPSELLLLPVQEKTSGNRNRQSMESMKERIADLDRQMRGISGKDRRNLRNVRNRIAAQLAELNPDGSPKSFGMGVQERESMVNANILLGGEVERPAQEVQRGFVQVMGDLNFTEKSNKSSGRLKLVKSLTSKENPLTARVMVNRIWMHLLGKPLVGTPNNFGLSGMKPENQELLDYLAVRFMRYDWSVKRLITEIVSSKTYQRSSKYKQENYVQDPDNKFLWRANPRLLEAESLRDALLSFSGQLNAERPRASLIASGAGRPRSGNLEAGNNHRSVYLPIVRDQVPSSLDLFDFPDPNISSAGRSESIVPTQALFMMNGEFVTAQAQSMAARLEKKYRTADEQIRYAFVFVYGRPATKEELAVSLQFFREFKPQRIQNAVPGRDLNSRPGKNRGKAGKGKSGGKRGGRGKGNVRGGAGIPTPAIASNQTLAAFCQTLMASARFRILN